MTGEQILNIALGMETGFYDFQRGSIHGLWIDDGTNTDILAITSEKPGNGNVSHFLSNLMGERRRIRFVHVGNAILAGMLRRRGFVDCEWFHRGEIVDGMRWTKPINQKETKCTSKSAPCPDRS